MLVHFLFETSRSRIDFEFWIMTNNFAFYKFVAQILLICLFSFEDVLQF